MAVSQSGVTIDIQRNVAGGGPGPDTYGNSTNQVKLTKIEDPASSGFWKFTHGPPSENSFTVAQVMFGSNTVPDIAVNPSDNIQHLSVWYWENDTRLSTPLLAEVKKQDGNFIYSYNKGGGTSWSPLDGKQNPQTTPLPGKTLETQLDHLNCKLNDAVTINLTFQNSSTLSETHAKNSGKNKYCCYYHNGTSGRISVDKKKISCKHQSPSGDCYKHTISSNYKLAKIKYNGRDRKNIKGPELNFPVQGPVSVYVLYCDRNPALIYVKGTGQNKWYKKPNDSNNGLSGDENWTDVTHTLEGATPKHFGKLERNQWNALVNVLNKFPGCGGLGTCNPPPPPIPAQSGQTAAPPSPTTPKGSEDTTITPTSEPSTPPSTSDSPPTATKEPAPPVTTLTQPEESDASAAVTAPGEKGGDTTTTTLPGTTTTSSAQVTTTSTSAGEGTDETTTTTTAPTVAAPGAQTNGAGSRGDSWSWDWGPFTSKLRGALSEAVNPFAELKSTLDGLPSKLAVEVMRAAPSLANLLAIATHTNLGGGGVGGHSLTETTPSVTTPPAPSEERDPEAKALAEIPIAAATSLWTAFGSTSGTLAGAGATFFGGWKLYNRYKGDPWVRQI